MQRVIENIVGNNVTFSSLQDYNDRTKWIGGFVHNTRTDWNWIISCDFTSLYP